MCLKCRDILLPLSENDNWYEAQTEWYPALSSEHVDKCICGINIKYQHPIQNILTGHTQILGSICILNDKIFEHNHNLIKHVKNSLKWYCPACDKKVTNKDMHLQSVKHILAQDLLDVKHKFFKCEGCKQYNILKPSTYKKCWTCHIKEYRKCIKCHKQNVKAKSNYKMCFKCNKNK